MAVLEEGATAVVPDSVVELVTEVVASNTKISVLCYDQFIEDVIQTIDGEKAMTTSFFKYIQWCHSSLHLIETSSSFRKRRTVSPKISSTVKLFNIKRIREMGRVSRRR